MPPPPPPPAPIIDRVGPYAIEYRAPCFDTLVRSIVSQQLSGKAARTIYLRLAGACGKRDTVTPAAILRLTPEEMRALGLSQQKTAYIRDLAEKTRARQVRFHDLAKLTDQQVIDRLTAVKGIGVWTVHMFLIFALERPDVLPVGDLGVQAAIQKAYGLEGRPKPAEMEALAASWRPYCSAASWYLWRSLETDANL
jgi:DNA-3-methyladenine glycosylase II